MSARRGTSRPADRPPLLGSRGLRRDRLGILGTLLPDPQLHRRLGKRQLELVVLQLQPPLISFHWRARIAGLEAEPTRGLEPRTARLQEAFTPRLCRLTLKILNSSMAVTAFLTWLKLVRPAG